MPLPLCLTVSFFALPSSKRSPFGEPFESIAERDPVVVRSPLSAGLYSVGRLLRGFVAVVAMALLASACFAQNLLDTSQWTIGSGSATGFSQISPVAENVREWGITPSGAPGILWKAVPDSVSNADGGWNTSYFPIDHEKMYRYSVWIKKTNSNYGTTYFGAYSDVYLTNLSGTPYSNYYFWSGDLPQLDRWYLLVGYIHASNDTSTTSYGGIYDGVTGEKVISARDFKFQSTATQARHRAYLYYDTNTSDRQYFYAPRVDLVDGNEPTIGALLKNSTTQSDSKWTSSGSDVFYSGGNVGVGTSAPANALDVNGTVRSKEVIVETGWADYVFEEGYQLPTLEEVENHIEQEGRLPGVPSAAEVAGSGVSLGNSQRMLLEKVEELTLYVIEQNQQSEELQNQVSELTERLRRIEEGNDK